MFKNNAKLFINQDNLKKNHSMKIIIYLFLASAFIYAGCKSDDNPTAPTTGEVEMFSTAISDSISGSFGSGNVSYTRNITSSSMNFTDRDSTRIVFSYKAASNTNDTLVYINAAGDTRLYTLRDASPTNTYKSVNVTVPSIKVNAQFYLTIKASTAGGVIPYIAIKDFKMYKK